MFHTPAHKNNVNPINQEKPLIKEIEEYQSKPYKFNIFWWSRVDYAYFEHDIEGDNYAGGMWFVNLELVDYDGVSELPEEVITRLEAEGYNMDYAK
jgi:hypothetical protein